MPWFIPQAPGEGFKAVLFDLDGVLTPTAEVHMAAWRRTFDDYFSAFGGAIDREQLSPGIYVWVWYEHRNPLRSGNPPRAAVVMPFSLDPDDQPEDARCDFGT